MSLRDTLEALSMLLCQTKRFKMSYQISTPISKVLEDVLAGKPVVLLDDEDRENEGDLFVATDRATEESIAFMMQYGRGLVCISIGRAVAERLRLPLQVIENRSKFKTAFTVSVDAKDVGQTGVTAKSRVFTMKKIIDPNSCPEDFVSPGHVFPLIANPAGVLGRHGQTEGSFDLARAAGLTPSGIICEILSNEGGMERGASLSQFALNHGLSITTVGDVIRYRVKEEILVREVADSTLATAYGNFKTIVFQDDVEGKEHLVLIKGDLGKGAPLLRIHSECLTGDVFGSRRCDCGEQLDIAVQSICREGSVRSHSPGQPYGGFHL